MSLDLTRNRKATHEHFAVAGSYTDTYIEVQGHAHNSNMPGWYVKWVPSNKSGSGYHSSVNTSKLASDGYVYYGSNTPSYAADQGGFYVLKFNYLPGSSNAGISLSTINTYWAHGAPFANAPDMDDMALALSGIMSGASQHVFAIFSFGKIGSSTNLYNTMRGPLRSWRFTRTIGSSSTPREYSYAAVGTNVNDIGLLSESAQGPGSNHPNAAVELAIEHDSATLGHAGYGEELSSGIGSGLREGTTQNVVSEVSRQIDWDATGHDRVLSDEYLRISFMGRMNHYGISGNNNGYYGIRIEDYYGTGTGQNFYFSKSSAQKASVDCFEKHEILYKRNSPHVEGAGNDFKIFGYMYPGSGSGAGQGTLNPNELGSFIRGLEVYRVGFNPDQDRDVAVHQWHANALNVNEGPADWDPGKAGEFETFWSSDRNLLDTTQSHSTVAFNGSGQSSLNYISAGGSVSGSWNGLNNVNWRGTNFTSTSVANTTHFAYEYRNIPTNVTFNRLMYGSNNLNGIPVDDSKIYMFGIWERIRYHDGNVSGYSPNRVSLTAKAVNSSGSALYLKDYNNSSVTDINNHYLSSVDIGQYVGNNWPSGQMNEWKLQTGFILPEWMTTTEVDNFYQSYWATWAGEYEWGNGNTSHQTVDPSYGLQNAKDARVAKMANGTAFIRPNIRVEQYSTSTLWMEFAYPFMLEIDPMNIRDGGHLWFWDFDENTNSMTV